MESIPFFSKAVNQNQAKDTGMAMALICLFVAYFCGINGCYLAAMILLISNMIWPRIFTPIVYFWFGLSKILGAVVSRILLSLLFFLLVTPIGLLRRMWGKDPMMLKDWKAGNSSVFKIRDREYQPEDMRTPY
jgi:hypothetical protein